MTAFKKLERTEARHSAAKDRLANAVGDHRRHHDADTRRELRNARRALQTASAALNMARRHQYADARA